MDPTGRNRDVLHSESNLTRRQIFMTWDGSSKTVSEWKGLQRVSAHFISTITENLSVTIKFYEGMDRIIIDYVIIRELLDQSIHSR